MNFDKALIPPSDKNSSRAAGAVIKHQPLFGPNDTQYFFIIATLFIGQIFCLPAVGFKPFYAFCKIRPRIKLCFADITYSKQTG